jgi:hypothetical protein
MSCVRFRYEWACAAATCCRKEVQEHTMSVFAVMDERSKMERPPLPRGWHLVEGLTYCDQHTVEVKAVIRTPTRILAFPGGRTFIGGEAVEEVRLRNAA